MAKRDCGSARPRSSTVASLCEEAYPWSFQYVAIKKEPRAAGARGRKKKREKVGLIGHIITLYTQCFGPPPQNHATSALPQHGFARNTRWEYMGKSSTESSVLMSKNASRGGDDNGVKVDFGLSSDSLSEEAKKAWPFKFSLVYSVTLGKDGLQTMLQVRNEGKEAFDFQMLLHSYFKVAVSLFSFYTSYLTLPYLSFSTACTQYI